MNGTNGTSLKDLRELTSDGWVIARDQGLWLVGKLSGELEIGHGRIGSYFWGTLSPVFELTCQVQQQPGGGIMLQYGAQPLLLIASLDTWPMEKATMWPVRGSSCEPAIRAAITRAEGMVQAMRAQQAGLVVAREMPKARIQ